ncbi:MAG: anti-sigma factor family protein [Terriglobia bacterium]
MNEHFREEDVVSYLDGRLSPDERTRVDQHLTGCIACRERLGELRSLLEVLGEWKPVEPSPGFDAALRARLADEAVAPLGWTWLRPAYAGALAVAVLAAVAFSLWQLSPPETPAPPELVRQATPETGPPAPVIELPPLQPVETDELTVLDNPVLLENYELLEKFDALFEPLSEDEEEL